MINNIHLNYSLNIDGAAAHAAIFMVTDYNPTT